MTLHRKVTMPLHATITAADGTEREVSAKLILAEDPNQPSTVRVVCYLGPGDRLTVNGFTYAPVTRLELHDSPERGG